MEKLYIKPTTTTPEVVFNIDGNLLIEGRSLPEDPVAFYQPLLDWLKEFDCNDINLNIKLEYFNTSSSKVIYELLKQIIKSKDAGQCIINWHYEEGDDDSLEVGEYYEDILNYTFNYFEFAEA